MLIDYVPYARHHGFLKGRLKKIFLLFLFVFPHSVVEAEGNEMKNMQRKCWLWQVGGPPEIVRLEEQVVVTLKAE